MIELLLVWCFNYGDGDMKIGDTVYPAYDGKPLRFTKCKITNIVDEQICVEGIFWGYNDEEVGIFSKGIDEDFPDAYIAYVGDDKSLMAMMNISESGDYYQLITEKEMGRQQQLLEKIRSSQIEWH